MKTLKELAKDALAVQDACNLSGVVHGFARCMSDMVEMHLDTDQRNTHPITLLWIDKLCHLSGYKQDYGEKVMSAYSAVHRLAEGGRLGIGDVIFYDGDPATVVEISKGEYGDRISFERNGHVLTTTPGLDPRFSLDPK